jgi:hypothetical protein
MRFFQVDAALPEVPMSFSYSQNCGQYVLMQDGKPVGRVLDEVAIAFDREGTLYKHGAPEMVTKWADTMKAKLRNSPASHLADDLLVITGRFPLAELNRCLDTASYVLRLYAGALDGTLAPMPYVPPPAPQPARRRMYA